jgi:hypothetical protein
MRVLSKLALFAAVLAAAVGCQMHGGHNLPPAEQLMHPGPGVTGPGPGVLAPQVVCPPAMPGPGAYSQVYFNKPEGMNVQWDVTGMGQFDSMPLVCPGRQNFPQGGMYRLKITSIPGREGVELYPTVEVGPATPRTEAFLGHNAIPIQLTEEDFDQVLTGNFVTKVIYLPDPEYQELALAGVETLVSTRLDPGVDPVTEADRRGSIMAIVRVGNKDLQMPGEMSMDGGVVRASYHSMPPGAGYGMPPGYGMSPGFGMGPMGPGGGVMPPPHVAGVTGPQWGMTQSGTPIGLVGPPHMPLGGPAGLKRHVMDNKTHYSIPGPTKHVTIDVKQQPGMHYPRPANKVHIREQTIRPAPTYHQPHGQKYQFVPSGPPACATCP